jgi:hypothetical protein
MTSDVKTFGETIPAGKILAILGGKIAEAQANLDQFPGEKYHQGAHDTAVNIMAAVKVLLADQVK